ncbi:hypothetical protein KC19_7G057400 [Ceratodon purpureus]|uniref:RNA exonuclease 4 n=2 Tax=Ceratodon purpureus TaxID=3225 RepID=A0A8T0H7L2_CERPU|nr:hypothetical protein KC19_7G057400 [Ceratodon purpureus]
MAKKRKHAEPATEPGKGKERLSSKDAPPKPAVSSNWMQLQAMLAKSNGVSSRKKSKVVETPVDTNATAGDGLSTTALLPTSDVMSLTKALALDCEMVGVGYEGKRNALARVSLVNQWGNLVYDKHVRPQEYVQDFRTAVSGVRSRDLRKAEDLYTVQKEVIELLKGRILVGHALHNDLKVLMLTHPKKSMRDTHSYAPYCNNGRPRALRHLASLYLGCQIQEGEHNSVEDARAAMALYQRVKDEWEKSLRYKGSKSHDKDKASSKTPEGKDLKTSRGRK